MALGFWFFNRALFLRNDDDQTTRPMFSLPRLVCSLLIHDLIDLLSYYLAPPQIMSFPPQLFRLLAEDNIRVTPGDYA